MPSSINKKRGTDVRAITLSHHSTRRVRLDAGDVVININIFDFSEGPGILIEADSMVQVHINAYKYLRLLKNNGLRYHNF